MAFLRCDFFSQALQMDTSIQVVFPEDADVKTLPVVYLFHGLGDNCTCWQRLVPTERYARRYRVVVVMPEVQRSWYADMALGAAYFTYVHKELPQFCHKLFGLSTRREQSYVMGLSMGGYGATKCALTQPFRYAGCASFSGALRLDEGFAIKPDALIEREWEAVMGRRPGDIAPGSSLIKLAQKAAGKEKLPALYITCGTEDFLLDSNRSYTACLRELGIAHSYEEWSGAHTWEFWQQSLEKAFAQFFGSRI